MINNGFLVIITILTGIIILKIIQKLIKIDYIKIFALRNYYFKVNFFQSLL